LLNLLYGRGSFDSAAIAAIYTALRFFALGLVAHTVLELAARAFFAQQDTLTPLFVAIASAVASILLGMLLMQPLGHGGLALANSVAVSAEVLVLFALLRRRWGRVDGRALALTLARVLAATAVMGATITAALALAAARSLAPLPTLALAAAAGAAAYLLACLVLRERAIFYLAAAVIRPNAKVTTPAPKLL
jgi:putative peptidoglycan lipid II flippase